MVQVPRAVGASHAPIPTAPGRSALCVVVFEEEPTKVTDIFEEGLFYQLPAFEWAAAVSLKTLEGICPINSIQYIHDVYSY